MEGRSIVHIPEEHVHRGRVNTGSVDSISSRGSTFSAQMVYDNNSTISSTGNYQLQHPNDWHAGSVSLWDRLAGNGSLSSIEPQDSQSASSGSAPEQQIPPPQHVRLEVGHKQSRSAAHHLRHPMKRRSNLARLANAFNPAEDQNETVDKRQGEVINEEQGEIIVEDKADSEEDKVSMGEFTDQKTKIHQMQLRGFDKTLAPRAACIPGGYCGNCRICGKYFKVGGIILSNLIALIWFPLGVKRLTDDTAVYPSGADMKFVLLLVILLTLVSACLPIFTLLCLIISCLCPTRTEFIPKFLLCCYALFISSFVLLLAGNITIVARSANNQNKILVAIYIMELVGVLIVIVYKFSLRARARNLMNYLLNRVRHARSEPSPQTGVQPRHLV